MQTEPVFKLSGVSRTYHMGDETVHAMRDVNLTIMPGEFVAIVGASGSGKSSLLNILGCLDRPTSGSVQVFGTPVADMSTNMLADLRGRKIGFVFQNYHLLPTVDATENVALAGLYSGASRVDRIARAKEMLTLLGLEDRIHHLPNQLSGGQQQRVAVARALFHDDAVILADEPTGSLDRAASDRFVDILKQLNADGRTIVLVTHDPNVAAHANRTITISDGVVEADVRAQGDDDTRGHAPPQGPQSKWLDLILETTAMSTRLMRQQLLRTMMTLFGIIVGIAAVISIIAVGDGARSSVLQTLNSLGSNLVVVFPDSSKLDLSAPRPAGFSVPEMEAVRELPQIQSAVLENPSTMTVTYGSKNTSTLVTATHTDMPIVHDWELQKGRFFTGAENVSMAPVAVLGSKVASDLFPGENPIGKSVSIGSSVFDVLGVMTSKGANPAGIDLDDVVLVPFNAAVLRLSKPRQAIYMMAKSSPDYALEVSAAAVQDLLNGLRGREETTALSLESLIAVELRAKDTLTALLSAVAFISLIVGAVGITNITLVSVLERTREIGLRKALGARNSQIRDQFLIETLLTTGIGGMLGIGVGIAAALALEEYGAPVEFSTFAIVGAFAMALITGVLAGFLPARRAAQLDPITALGMN
jgi:macrolide transport system ATP-binding/permease protein